MRRVIVIAFLLLPFLLVAQKHETKNYTWDKKPERLKISSEAKQKNTATLLDKRFIEYIYGENDELVTYRTYHKLIRVNVAGALSKMKSLEIPLKEGEEIVNYQLRVLTPRGKEVPQPTRALLPPKNGVRSFPYEGLEEGGELEYIYTIKSEADLFGREIFQNDEWVYNASIAIISPKNLVFKSKSYNDFPELNTENRGNKMWLNASTNEIKPLQYEPYSTLMASRQRVEYKINYNTASGFEELYTWQDAGKRYYESIYQNGPSEKDVTRILKELKIPELAPSEKIRTIENYVKKQYKYDLDFDGGDNYWQAVFNKKASDRYGLVSLFANLCYAANLEHEMVLTSDRYHTPFDKDFMSWNYLEEYLFFFHGVNRWVAPDRMQLPYGLVPNNWVGQYGLFIKPPFKGKELQVETRKVDPLDTDALLEYSSLQVALVPDTNYARLRYTRKIAAYDAYDLRMNYAEASEKEKEEMALTLATEALGEVEVKKPVLRNMEPERDQLSMPVVFRSRAFAKDLFESDGENLKLNLGKVLIDREALEENKKRLNEIVLTLPAKTMDEIRVIIPNGYKFINEGDFNFTVDHVDGDEEASFTCVATVSEGTIVLSITEEYKNCNYDKSNYEAFRKVVNAAVELRLKSLIFERIPGTNTGLTDMEKAKMEERKKRKEERLKNAGEQQQQTPQQQQFIKKQ